LALVRDCASAAALPLQAIEKERDKYICGNAEADLPDQK
jgi:hypothetical protein